MWIFRCKELLLSLVYRSFRFDSEIQRVKEELSHERTLKDKLNREKEKVAADKYKLEHDLAVSYTNGVLGLSITRIIILTNSAIYCTHFEITRHS